MRLTVRDVKKLWENRSATLVAGEGGLDHVVDYYDMMEQPDFQPWLRENVLMITTGYAIRNDKKALLSLIRSMHEARCAALAIKTRFFSEFPKEALELADELKLPLFFLNNDTGFIEAVYPVMVAIVEAKNSVELSNRYQMGEYNQKELDRKLFWDLVNGKVNQEADAEYRVNALHWPAAPLRVLVFGILQDSYVIASREENLEKIYSNVKMFFDTNKIWGNIVTRKDECICVIRSSMEEKEVQKICLEIRRRIRTRYKYECIVGVSGSFYSYLEMKKSYQDARDAVRIARNPRFDREVLWIEQEPFDQMALHLSKEAYVRKYVNETLACLEIFDREHEAHLEETQIALIRHHGSRKLAAEALFLHRNTMSYRIKQIEKLMNCDLSDADHMLRLGFALRIKEYMQEV